MPKRDTLVLSFWFLICFLPIHGHPASEVEFSISVFDKQTSNLLPARIYLSDLHDKKFYFLRHKQKHESYTHYNITNWINKNAFEKYSSITEYPVSTKLPPGVYKIVVEKGKEYIPLKQTIHINSAAGEKVHIDCVLTRLVDMNALGWYSTDTHIHRTFEELRVEQIVENLNVTFPLTSWVTESSLSPQSGNKSQQGIIPRELIALDPLHLIWPQNTEYEIFSVNNKRHTLGALFVLGHKEPLVNKVPPWESVADLARAQGAFMDMDKFDWPFSFVLPPITGARLYELANNHVWKTSFSFVNWNTVAPSWMQPPFGGQLGNEWDWLRYTWGMFYTLTNAGFDLVPTAGTATGVHPVPAGYSRVYVPVENEFSYDKFVSELNRGKGFVTNGPMLMVTLDNMYSGHMFDLNDLKIHNKSLTVKGSILSAKKIAFIDMIENGIPVKTIMPRNHTIKGSQLKYEFAFDYQTTKPGWVAFRCFSEGEPDKVEFAHTGVWRISEDQNAPITLTEKEKDFLIKRVKNEIKRSKDIVNAEAIKEYEKTLTYYKNLPATIHNPLKLESRIPKSKNQKEFWLKNSLLNHQYSIEQTQLATGLEEEAIFEFLQRGALPEPYRPEKHKDLLVLPYPGGKHPRIGFLDGAINPQRDTKFSLFTPWDSKSYVVVDLPEAIWANGGLYYLAHKHIPTVWEKANPQFKNQKLEWNFSKPGGTLYSSRIIPTEENPSMSYKTKVVPLKEFVAMELTLSNHSSKVLKSLSAQICNHLMNVDGFQDQTSGFEVRNGSMIAKADRTRSKWIITGWENWNRSWNNPPVPCIHSDPKFSDCDPGQSVTAVGFVSFYEGNEIHSHMKNLSNAIYSRIKSVLKSNPH